MAATPQISHDAVKAKTGKDWTEWFAILDAVGAQQMTHQQIVALLAQDYKVGEWWQQMVAVTYEQGRGMRAKHEQAGGFQISRSKTLAVPVEAAFVAWTDAEQRQRWLGEPGLALRIAASNKTLRLDWKDGKSKVEVRFTPKGDQKCQVTVQHSKLPDAEHAEAMKVYWSEALERLSTASS